MVALAARKDEEQPGLTGLNKTFMAELGREVSGEQMAALASTQVAIMA